MFAVYLPQLLLTDHFAHPSVCLCASVVLAVRVSADEPPERPGPGCLAWVVTALVAPWTERGSTLSNVEAKRGGSSSLQGVHNRDSLPRVALSFSLLPSVLHVIGWIGFA